MTLEQLKEARAALVAARASGIREVQDSSGERVAYRSDSEIAAAIRALDSEIAAIAVGHRPASAIRFSTSKGL